MTEMHKNVYNSPLLYKGLNSFIQIFGEIVRLIPFCRNLTENLDGIRECYKLKLTKETVASGVVSFLPKFLNISLFLRNIFKNKKELV